MNNGLVTYVRPSTATAAGHIRLEKTIFWLIALFFSFQVLEAPLRWVFNAIDLDAAIYLPKVFLFAAILALPLLRWKASRTTLLLSALIIIYLFWGMINLSNSMQALFGLWVLVPFMFGLWVAALLDVRNLYRLFSTLFVIAAAGVLFNPLISYPWSGQTMDLFGQSIEGSREWTAFGVERYAGFARASFNAASQLLILATFLVVLLEKRWIKFLVWMIAGAGIALTTSKGAIGAWVMLSMYFAGGWLVGWQRFWPRLWLVGLAIIIVAMVLSPLSSLWIEYTFNLDSLASKFLFASFGERLTWMWPDSLHLLDLSGAWHWWVGRGVGGIGAAQQYFEPLHYLAADNLFVYLAVDLGLPLSLLIIILLWLKTTMSSLRSTTPTLILPVILLCSAYGIVVNIIEEPILSLALGLSMLTPKYKPFRHKIIHKK